MAVGKLLTLLLVSNAYAEDIGDPKFFEYQSAGFIDNLTEMSFGWFKSLDPKQRDMYHQSVIHAVMYAENGQKVQWQHNNAGGLAVPVMTWPVSNGYCRRIHIQARAYNVDKSMSATACFNDINNLWAWNTDKY